MSIADKLTTIAENEQKIYDKGFENGENESISLLTRGDWCYFNIYDARLEWLQRYFKPEMTSASRRFDSMFGFSTITEAPMMDTSEGTEFKEMFSMCSKLQRIPQYNLSKATSCNKMFYNCSVITEIPDLDTKKCQDFNYMFYGCSSLVIAPSMDMSRNNNMSNMYYNCTKLTTIPRLGISGMGTNPTNPFGNCKALTEITSVEGTLPRTLSFSSSPLNVDTMKRIIKILKNYAGTTNASKYTITFSATCWEALEASGTPYNDGLTEDETLTWEDYVASLGWLI